MSLLAIESFILTALSWTTSQKQIKHLLEDEDFQQWESFRDSLVSRWSIGNLAVGGLLLENVVVDQSIFSVVLS